MTADVLIVGAGMAGLMAAQTLRARGYSALLIERERDVGGRLATAQVGAQGFADQGAQFFTVRSDTLQSYVERWLAAGLVYVWGSGWSDGSTKRTVSDGHPRYAARGGMKALAQHLAAELDIVTERLVLFARQTETGWSLTDSLGTGYTSRALLLTPPMPATLALLARSGVFLHATDYADLRRIRFGPCLCGLHTIEGEIELPPPGAVQNFQSDIYWLADNQAKRHLAGAYHHQPRQRQIQPPELGSPRSGHHPGSGVGAAALSQTWRAHRPNAA